MRAVCLNSKLQVSRGRPWAVRSRAGGQEGQSEAVHVLYQAP